MGGRFLRNRGLWPGVRDASPCHRQDQDVKHKGRCNELKIRICEVRQFTLIISVK